MAKELSRRELFDLVWSKPMTKVAADFGVSDVAVHKICVKHRIPVPGRGYWAKRSAGKPVKPVLFHEIKDSSLNRVEIHGSALVDLPPEVLAARQKAREEVKARRTQREAIPSMPLPAPTDDLHKIAIQMREKFEKAKPGTDGFIRISGRSVFSVIATPTTTARLVVFFNRLASEVERRGYALEPEEKGLRISADGEVMVIAITEKTDRVPHIMTEKEEAALRRWEAERDRKQKRGEWWSDWDKPKAPEWGYVPNGKLSLTINEGQHWDGLRRRFSDGKSRGLEDMVDQIIEGFATLAAAEKAKRAEAERRQKEWEEEAKRRKECERRRVLQQKRLEFLKRPMERLEDARRLEAFVDDYLAAYPLESLPLSCRRLIEWAKAHASLLRESVAPDQLTEILDKHRLMDDAAEIPSWISFQ